jgi:DNA-binding transcriptional LysR family regulator
MNNPIYYTLQQLRVLKAIAKDKNFKNASETLYISQPSLTKQIKMLEARTGLLLIDRSNASKKVTLTEVGSLFLHYAERILSLCEETSRVVKNFKKGERGNLTIGSSQTVGTYLIPQILVLYNHKYPQINFNIKIVSTQTILQGIIERQIDIAIIIGEIPKKFQKKVNIESFVEDELLLIIPKSHPFAKTKKNSINKDDLYHLNFITLPIDSTIRQIIDNILLKNQIQTNQFNITIQFNSIEAVKMAVNLGLGSAFIFSSSLKRENELQNFKIFKVENTRLTKTLSIIMNFDFEQNQALKFFYQELINLRNAVKS